MTAIDNRTAADQLAAKAREQAELATDEGHMMYAGVLAMLAIRAELRYLGDAVYQAAGGVT